ncbi:hypothetical protein AB0J21_04955 [Streptomyces sp. NPDC049954]|uniref:hypothetical protein n=1 Tax=Streptomyces sp. NPDC049954 TaxID=3155779 RepID=UPI00343EB077
MERKTSPTSRRRPATVPVHDWIPAHGHALRHVGVHFDAVRIAGFLGEQVAYEIMQFTNFEAGPVVRELSGGRAMYFLLAPGTAGDRRWPAGARVLHKGDGRLAYVGVPALEGLTWPLDWRSRPTREYSFVDADLLHEMVGVALTVVP